MDSASLIEAYLGGPALIREAVSGMSAEQLDARPIPGKWSTREVVAHLADFEPVYADRMKRVIAEDEPLLLAGDPDVFAARLAYTARDLDEELALIEAVRKHTARVLKAVGPAALSRNGRHSVDGLLTLETLLTRITGHVPHHIGMIRAKRKALGI